MTILNLNKTSVDKKSILVYIFFLTKHALIFFLSMEEEGGAERFFIPFVYIYVYIYFGWVADLLIDWLSLTEV